ncbi:MAG: acyl-CoA/acyl-ACP dehydrogenase, partial [Dehalococcoidia bacterium]|nr:acyl-CoA/acyl-ACP dehydrogenase [Dehalococcoidia bacterium]
AELWLSNETGRLLSYRTAWMQEAGRIANYEASVIKVFATELGAKITGSASIRLALPVTWSPSLSTPCLMAIWKRATSSTCHRRSIRAPARSRGTSSPRAALGYPATEPHRALAPDCYDPGDGHRLLHQAGPLPARVTRAAELGLRPRALRRPLARHRRTARRRA